MTAPVTSYDLEGYLELHRTRVEEALARAADAIVPKLTEATAAAVRHGLLGGGKRLRPILCIAAHEACGGASVRAAYDLAASLEMIHAYSLMHDDLPCMDDAELRRGRPTTHITHGEAATVRAGLALIPAAAHRAWSAARALGCDAARARRAAATLLEAAGAGGMVGGQWLDLRGEGEALGPEALDELHRRKTGALLAGSLQVGAIAAGATPELERRLVDYGRAIGLAFQIADDILDATQTAETLGKNPSDSELDKSTYVSLYGLDEARRRAGEEVARAVDSLEGIDAPALSALARYIVERRK